MEMAVQSERSQSLWTPDIRRLARRITFAGCLAMIYMEFTGSTPIIEYSRRLGMTDFEFGILGALAPAMLPFQFVAGLLLQRIRSRKRIWIPLVASCRLFPVPIALLPWVFPEAGNRIWIWGMLGLIAVGEMLANLGVPMWFSWMGDIIPKGIMSEFWARRRRWLVISQALATLLVAGAFVVFRRMDARLTYLVLATVGAAAGVWDILLFLKVPEPPMERRPRMDARLALEPFRDPDFRRFIFFGAYWSFAATFSFVFFRLYMLETLHLTADTVNLLYCCHALGGALLTEHFGILGDRVGNRPVIILCSTLKSLVVIAMLLARPGLALLILVPSFLLDNMLNTGMFVSQNTYLLRQSPKENRPLYIAASMATAGLCGSAGSFVSGQWLEMVGGRTWTFFGTEWNRFHVVFAISAILRMLAVFAAVRIREPRSRPAEEVLTEIVGPAIYRRLSIPLDFVWRFFEHEEEDGRESGAGSGRPGPEGSSRA